MSFKPFDVGAWCRPNQTFAECRATETQYLFLEVPIFLLSFGKCPALSHTSSLSLSLAAIFDGMRRTEKILTPNSKVTKPKKLKLSPTLVVPACGAVRGLLAEISKRALLWCLGGL